VIVVIRFISQGMRIELLSHAPIERRMSLGSELGVDGDERVKAESQAVGSYCLILFVSSVGI
jgi:hypothetical protein